MFTLPALPYELDALEPYISKRTVEFHYYKHHQGYIKKLNDLIVGTEFATQSLEDIIKSTYNKPEYIDIYNNAAQTWNHNMYWKSMRPNGGLLADGKMLNRIDENFGSYENFKTLMREKSLGQFGSGWAWLAEDNQHNLLIYSTSNADNPLIHNHKAILTIDVWEHAYYLDYQNLRINYVNGVLDYLLNWDNANFIE